MVNNKRMAKCVDCNVPLPAGAGIGNENRFNLEGVRYRCPECHEKNVSVETAFHNSRPSRDRIRKLLAGNSLFMAIDGQVFQRV